MNPADQRQDASEGPIKQAYRSLLAGNMPAGGSPIDCEPFIQPNSHEMRKALSAADLGNALSFLQSASQAYIDAVSYTELLLRFCEDLTTRFEDEVAQKEAWKRRALECEDHATRLVEQITLRDSEGSGERKPSDPVSRKNPAGLRLG